MRTVTLATAIVVLVVAGVAFAYWTAEGGGSGTATSGTTSAVTLSAGSPASQLHPGGQSDVVLTITNPNAATVRIGTLALDTVQGTGGFSVDGAHSGCGLATLSFTTQTNGGSGWTVSGGGSLSVTLASALSMSTSAADACQGATFTVYLAAS